MKTVLVKLKKRFNESISTRSAIENLFEFNRDKVNCVILDFDGIRLISSSAAHQLILEVKNLKTNTVDVQYSNVDDNVRTMLSLAEKDRKNLFTLQNVQHKKVNSSKELDKFLLDC